MDLRGNRQNPSGTPGGDIAAHLAGRSPQLTPIKRNRLPRWNAKGGGERQTLRDQLRRRRPVNPKAATITSAIVAGSGTGATSAKVVPRRNSSSAPFREAICTFVNEKFARPMAEADGKSSATSEETSAGLIHMVTEVESNPSPWAIFATTKVLAVVMSNPESTKAPPFQLKPKFEGVRGALSPTSPMFRMFDPPLRRVKMLLFPATILAGATMNEYQTSDPATPPTGVVKVPVQE